MYYVSQAAPEDEDCEDEEESEPAEEEDCDDEADEQQWKRSLEPSAPVVLERQAHHHVFSHSKRHVDVALDPAMQDVIKRQAAIHEHTQHGRAHHSRSFGSHKGLTRVFRR